MALAKKIYLVEDDADIHLSLKELLESEGYRVAGSGDGQSALDELRAMDEKPSLVLLDLRLPIKDGAQFRFEQMGDDSLRSIPVVVLSADPGPQEDFFAQDPPEMLRKPVDLDELLRTVKRYCADGPAARPLSRQARAPREPENQQTP